MKMKQKSECCREVLVRLKEIDQKLNYLIKRCRNGHGHHDNLNNFTD